ncbi:MAG: YihY/virulence factor BrkB family protein [Desulfobacteraceae bacterium]|nr:YihY/virulence factor BrkB family protein [Desulfobacteraceae bacterium]
MPGRRDDRGRSAAKPRQIPATGWRDILLRVKDEYAEDNLSIIAAGVAFYAFMAIFPALAAMVSIYGLVADPGEIQQELSGVKAILPQEAYGIITHQLQTLTSKSGTLGWGALIGILLALWSAASGMKALINALNIAYEEEESRGFIRLNLIALLLTLASVVFVLVALGLIAALPVLLDTLGMPAWLAAVLAWGRWPLLLLLVILALGFIYRYAPDRNEPRWRWVTVGSATAAVLWLAGSGLFSFYVSHFGSYNRTYGSLAAIVILLLWFYLSSFAVLVGAELNAEMEHQTREDTTRGEGRPMGERGAKMADTLGRKP